MIYDDVFRYAWINVPMCVPVTVRKHATNREVLSAAIVELDKLDCPIDMYPEQATLEMWTT